MDRTHEQKTYYTRAHKAKYPLAEAMHHDVEFKDFRPDPVPEAEQSMSLGTLQCPCRATPVVCATCFGVRPHHRKHQRRVETSVPDTAAVTWCLEPNRNGYFTLTCRSTGTTMRAQVKMHVNQSIVHAKTRDEVFHVLIESGVNINDTDDEFVFESRGVGICVSVTALLSFLMTDFCLDAPGREPVNTKKTKRRAQLASAQPTSAQPNATHG